MYPSRVHAKERTNHCHFTALILPFPNYPCLSHIASISLPQFMSICSLISTPLLFSSSLFPFHSSLSLPSILHAELWLYSSVYRCSDSLRNLRRAHGPSARAAHVITFQNHPFFNCSSALEPGDSIPKRALLKLIVLSILVPFHTQSNWNVAFEHRCGFLVNPLVRRKNPPSKCLVCTPPMKTPSFWDTFSSLADIYFLLPPFFLYFATPPLFSYNDRRLHVQLWLWH